MTIDFLDDDERGPIRVESMKQAMAWVKVAKRAGQMFCVLQPIYPIPVVEVKTCPLSRRELEILQLYAEGYSLKETAKRLELSPLTIKSHQHRIAVKINRGVSNKEALVAIAMRARWIQ